MYILHFKSRAEVYYPTQTPLPKRRPSHTGPFIIKSEIRWCSPGESVRLPHTYILGEKRKTLHATTFCHNLASTTTTTTTTYSGWDSPVAISYQVYHVRALKTIICGFAGNTIIQGKFQRGTSEIFVLFLEAGAPFLSWCGILLSSRTVFLACLSPVSRPHLVTQPTNSTLLEADITIYLHLLRLTTTKTPQNHEGGACSNFSTLRQQDKLQRTVTDAVNNETPPRCPKRVGSKDVGIQHFHQHNWQIATLHWRALTETKLLGFSAEHSALHS